MVEHHGLIGEGGEGNLPTFFIHCINGKEDRKNVNGKHFLGAGWHQEGEYRVNYADDMEREERKAEEWI